MIEANCSGVVKRFCVRIVALSSAAFASGRSPSWPPGDWLFCSCTAASASAADKLISRELVGIEPDAHRVLGGERADVADARQRGAARRSRASRRSCRARATVSAPLFEVSAMIIKKADEALLTRMPCRRTSSGRRCSTARRRFCTSICATSMSVPDANVTVIDAVPFDWLDDVMYRKPSTPFSSCSMTCVTFVSSIEASAPG